MPEFIVRRIRRPASPAGRAGLPGRGDDRHTDDGDRDESLDPSEAHPIAVGPRHQPETEMTPAIDADPCLLALIPKAFCGDITIFLEQRGRRWMKVVGESPARFSTKTICNVNIDLVILMGALGDRRNRFLIKKLSPRIGGGAIVVCAEPPTGFSLDLSVEADQPECEKSVR